MMVLLTNTRVPAIMEDVGENMGDKINPLRIIGMNIFGNIHDFEDLYFRR